MLRYALIFFLIAVVAGVFGFGGIAGAAAGDAPSAGEKASCCPAHFAGVV